jgi:molecular chaperone HtpG
MSLLDFLQPDVNQIRHSIKDIDDSYNHSWDILAELCQNAVDAIRRGNPERGLITIAIDSNEKSISISDNGVGIAPDKIPALLKPFSTDKAQDEETIGEKGVGLTFVVFACNDFYIKSGNATGTSEGKVLNAYAWKNSIDLSPLKLEHKALTDSYQGTFVEAKGIENPSIFNLKLKQLVYVLRTKTAIGNTRVLWTDDKEIDVILKFKDQEGQINETRVPFKYWLPTETLPENAKLDFDEFVRWKNATDRTDHEKRSKLKDKVVFRNHHFEHSDQRLIRYASCFVPRRVAWEKISVSEELCTLEQVQDNQWIENFGFVRFEGGIYSSVKGMPTGISTEHPSTGGAGYWSNIFIIFEDPKLKFDIGRKSIHGKQAGVLRDYSRRLFNDYVQNLTKYLSGDVETNEEWNRDEVFAEIEALVDLNIPDFRFKKSPADQEASVAALFFEGIGNRKIRDIIPLCSGYRNKYDLYALWGKKKLVIEFKSRLRNILRDFDDMQKMFSEINCLVCWEVSGDDEQELANMGMSLEKIEASPLASTNTQTFPHATHKLVLSGYVPPIYVIDLKVALS